jgi:UDP-N-acetyl-D-mannosaminuronic acid dehydrogenase
VASKIGVIGAGFVGLTLVARLLDSEDCDVVVYEKDFYRAEKLLNGETYVYEPGLKEILSENLLNERLRINSNEMLDALFITIGTPKNYDKDFLNNILKSILIETITRLKIGALVFLRSTVSIGTSNWVENTFIEVGRSDLQVFFAPERTAEGVALTELRELPQILGAADNSNLNDGKNFLMNLDFEIVETSNSKVAEFSKLICNTWRDVTFAYSNEIALMSEHFKIDSYEAISVANKDYPRSKVPVPGPVGGPCLTKDTYILLSNFPKEFSDRSMIFSARKINEFVFESFLTKIIEVLDQHPNLEVLLVGIAFKGFPKTNDFRNGLGFYLLEELLQKSVRVSFYDPTINTEDTSKINEFRSNKIVFKEDQVVVLCNDSAELFTPEFCKSLVESKKLIIDATGYLRKNGYISNNLITFGISEAVK